MCCQQVLSNLLFQSLLNSKSHKTPIHNSIQQLLSSVPPPLVTSPLFPILGLLCSLMQSDSCNFLVPLILSTLSSSYYFFLPSQHSTCSDSACPQWSSLLFLLISLFLLFPVSATSEFTPLLPHPDSHYFLLYYIPKNPSFNFCCPLLKLLSIECLARSLPLTTVNFIYPVS